MNVVQHHTSQSQFSSPGPQSSSVDEQKQLDDILSELLGESAMIPQGQVTTYNAGNNSWSTSQREVHEGDDGRSRSVKETIKSFSNPDPYTKSETVTVKKMSYSHSGPDQYERPVIDDNRSQSTSYTYRPISPQQSYRTESVRTTSPSPIRSPSPRVHNPYNVGYENREYRSSYETHAGEEPSWLQQQQMKLRARREGREIEDLNKRTAQEKLLVAELKNAQKGYQVRRTHSESEERPVVESYTSRYVTRTEASKGSSQPNGPLVHHYRHTSEPRDLRTTESHTEKKSVSVQQQPISYTVTITPGQQRDKHQGAITTKPPPSPGPVRSPSPIAPSRSSSREVMKSRTWQSHNRPLARQRSDTSYDRERSLKWQRPESPKTIVYHHHTTEYHTDVNRPTSPVAVIEVPVQPKVVDKTEGKVLLNLVVVQINDSRLNNIWSYLKSRSDSNIPVMCC